LDGGDERIERVRIGVCQVEIRHRDLDLQRKIDTGGNIKKAICRRLM